jgi:hypothetical protein
MIDKTILHYKILEKLGEEGIRNLKRVLEFDQDDVDALLWLAILLALTGKTAEARLYGDRLGKSDPLTPFNYAILAQAPYYAQDSNTVDRFRANQYCAQLVS